MCSAAGPQRQRTVDLARPHPGRVDDRTGRHVERLSGALVGQPHRGAGGLGCGHVGQDPGAVLRRGARDRGDQSGVVDQLPVVGEQSTVKAVTSNGRSHLHDALRRNPARPRQGRRRRTRKHPQRVAGEKSGAHQRALGVTHRRQQRNQLRHRMHQMRGVACHQDSALDGAAPGDSHIAGRQVAQTAVDQFGTPAAGAERQIVLFHQRDPQAA